MRFIVMVKANEESEAGVLPSAEMLAKMGAFNEQMAKAGVMLAGEGLQPSSKGARMTFSRGKPSVTEGPFPNTKELIAGFWLIRVKSKAEAIEWLSRCPFEGGEEIEIRQVYELDDFGPAVTPPVREQEERLRAETGRQP
jgi:hypothetical protein